MTLILENLTCKTKKGYYITKSELFKRLIPDNSNRTGHLTGAELLHSSVKIIPWKVSAWTCCTGSMNLTMAINMPFRNPVIRLQLTNQMRKGIHLPGGRSFFIKITHQANPDPALIHPVGLAMSPGKLFKPTRRNFNLTIFTIQAAIINHKMITNTIPTLVQMSLIEKQRIPLIGGTMMNNNMCPALGRI